MLPAEFDYAAPGTLDEALSLLAENEDARLLAGGQSLLPAMKLRLDRPAILLDLRHLAELRYIREADGEIAIGTLTTYREIAASGLLTGGGRCLAEAAAAVGDVQVRNQGTLGGSLAHADPAADLPAAALALECSMVVRSRSGERAIPASDFFLGLWATALEPDEILTEIRFAKGRNSGGAYEKLRQPASGFALVGAAAFVELDGDTIGAARVALTGVSARPLRLHSVETRLAGQPLTEEIVRGACSEAGAAISNPLHDTYASAEYRTAMAAVASSRAILRAAA